MDRESTHAKSGLETGFFSRNGRSLLVGVGLVVITLFLYWASTRYDFVDVDDNVYVYDNPQVKEGLHWGSVKWAFTTTHASNWHPLTWITHLADYSMYGDFAGGHHRTNILLHALNTLLLFLALKRLSGAFWASALVAAMFGWHPLHVESVAWVSERKDVLSTFFLFLTLWAYVNYAQMRDGVRCAKSERSSALTFHVSRFTWFILALVLFALGLMSKPMLVTLPFVLLLLDFWPLGRVSGAGCQVSGETTVRTARLSLRTLLIEKLPFFVVAGASGLITVIAQRSGGALRTLQAVPFFDRMLNAIVAYGLYLWKAVWPSKLCVYYILPPKTPMTWVIASAVLLLSITCGVVLWRRRYPWLLVGWFWFVGTLVPVIGLVQVGNQALADRYTYIPYIGLFVMVAWSLKNWMERWPALRVPVCGMSAVLLAACALLSWHQLGFWRDSITLFTRALQVTPSNVFSEANLSYALSMAGRGGEAIPHYEAVLRFEPADVAVRNNLGLELITAGRLDEAAVQFAEGLKYQPDDEKLHDHLGVVLLKQGNYAGAMERFRRAMELNPRFPPPYLNYGIALQSQGMGGPAVNCYVAALKVAPGWPEALERLAFVLAICPDPQWRRPAEAIRFAQSANENSGNKIPDYLSTLGLAYASAGQFTNAIFVAAQASQLARGSTNQALAVKIEKELESYRKGMMIDVDWTRSVLSTNAH